MEKDQRFYELLVALGLALLSCFLLYTAFTTRATASPGMMSAMDFPKAVLFGILALSLYLAVRNLLFWKNAAAGITERVRTDPRVWATAGLIIAYALAWRYISFSLATLAYVFVQAKLLDRALRWRRCLLVSLAATAVVLLVFRVIFKVSLSENLLAMLGVVH